MTEKTESATFSFGKDSKEYKVDELNEEQRALFDKFNQANNDVNKFVVQANWELEKLNILKNHFGNTLEQLLKQGEKNESESN